MWKAWGEVTWLEAKVPDALQLPHTTPVKVKLAICPIRPTTPTSPLPNNGQSWVLGDLPELASPQEVNGFATAKRVEEHLAGRYLLCQMLLDWGIEDLSALEVTRDDKRAPSLEWIEGTFKTHSLPNISIGHSGDWAIVALVNHDWFIGVDAEPVDRIISPNAFPMMAKGDELDKLIATPNSAILRWTVKEAVQKCMRMGMHLNPRDIVLHIGNPIEHFEAEFSIEKSIIQLISWAESGQQISLAFREYVPPPMDSLDVLLAKSAEELKNYVQVGEDGSKEYSFDVGCSTTRHCQ
ncbi:MAG: 4'-phosphopantetheinyl transferase superfamily protein [Euryarchaeota archaeon]|jgi:hypothetical protein|nr:4'-phosphopantetheinyl transferase superfamily protein [Euryarchaeota archaeon]MBT4407968.1 4'-phosphopantetheinyl transferase superfamily protein [Euryarchaeota archaeon]